MSNQDMINAILTSIQTQSNLNTLLQLMISNNIINVSTAQLQAMCAALNINTSGS